MWLTKWKNVSVHFGFIHYVIWRALPTPDLSVVKLLICSEQTFMCEIPISLVSKPSLRFPKHEIQFESLMELGAIQISFSKIIMGNQADVIL